MDKIEAGKYVELIYDLFQVNDDKSETLVHQSVASDPERFVFGVSEGLLPAFEKGIKDKSAGDEFDIKASAAEAFGAHDPELVMKLDKDLFVVDGKFDDKIVKVGSYVPMMSADGYRMNGFVTEITDDKVVMDFNHPLADKDVRFVGKILTVRDAKPEDLQPAHGCGGGCGGGCCGGGDSSCGEGGCCGGC